MCLKKKCSRDVQSHKSLALPFVQLMSLTVMLDLIIFEVGSSASNPLQLVSRRVRFQIIQVVRHTAARLRIAHWNTRPGDNVLSSNNHPSHLFREKAEIQRVSTFNQFRSFRSSWLSQADLLSRHVWIDHTPELIRKQSLVMSTRI